MKRILVLLILTASLKNQAQQDPQYNLYQFNQMIINPAYAGARDGIAVVANVRNQWVGFSGAPKTACLSMHSPIMNKHIGVGLTVINDQMGPRNWMGVYANFSYIAKLSNKFKLSFGLNGGYNRYQFDFSKINLKYNESNNFYTQQQSYNKLDLNAGIFLKSNSFFMGLSATHLDNSPVYTLKDTSGKEMGYRLRTHLFLTMGKSFKISDNFIFAPTIMLRNGGEVSNGDLNLNFFIFKKLWLGVFYKGSYGPGFLMQYYVTDKFRVGYSYDTGMNDARILGASHEVMLGFDFSGNKSKVISPRFL